MLENIKNDILVFDIETYAQRLDGSEININSCFEEYVEKAKCKWVGCYSYKHNKAYNLEVSKHYHIIKDLFEEHNILVGYNNEEFDYPIMVNNGLIDSEKFYNHVDCMKILCSSRFKDKNGFKYKDRGTLMEYKFKNNSLATIAETMGLEHQKGSIDYQIFKKDRYTEEERKEIVQYLENDVMATKQAFDKLWDYWKPFTNLLYPHDIQKLTWIKSSIASLIYKSACFIMNTDATFAEHITIKEEMGGRVIEPKYEEIKNAWYIDFSSLYPHIFCMFNLFAETSETFGETIWHGNDVFEVKGYYNIANQHPLSKAVQEKLKQRTDLKKTDPENSMIYTLKIWLNGLYGIARSSIFEKVHTPNCGWDCCWLGRQIQMLTEQMMDEFGFETVAGDTDSLFVISKDEKNNNREYVEKCLKSVVNKIMENVPFPVDTFNMDIENFLPYVLFPFSDQPIVDEKTGENLKKGNRLVKERKGKKKNYLYIYEKNGEKKVKLVGLPIMKDNATKLGIKIYNEILEPLILENGRAKFTQEFIDEKLNEFFKNEEILKLLCVEYKVKPFNTYKNDSQLQAQISKEYFGGGDGVINLLKNKKIGSVGKATKYCTAEEAKRNQLTIKDLDLDKIYNELSPFILNEKLSKV